jgi:hypothetical protein
MFAGAIHGERHRLAAQPQRRRDRGPAEQRPIGDGAKRVQVGPRTFRAVGQVLFRRRVAVGQLAVRRRAGGLDRRRRTEIDDDRSAIRPDHDVRRLEVAMQPARGVKRSDRVGERAKELDQPLIGEPAIAPGEDGIEIAALDPFQDDERAIAVAAGVPEANDPGMIELFEKRRFARPALAPWSELDEHPLAGRAVGGLEPVRRAALPRLQAITVRQDHARRRLGVPLDCGAGRRHGRAYSSVLVGMV